MTTKNLRQTVVFKAEPREVYDALMDSRKHATFTGDTASIGKKVGERFRVYGGYIQGKNLELIPGKKIVQSWNASDWNEEVSQVTFLFEKIKEGTKLIFLHEGIPEEQFVAIKEGWKEHYWDKMKEVFGW